MASKSKKVCMCCVRRKRLHVLGSRPVAQVDLCRYLVRVRLADQNQYSHNTKIRITVVQGEPEMLHMLRHQRLGRRRSSVGLARRIVRRHTHTKFSADFDSAGQTRAFFKNRTAQGRRRPLTASRWGMLGYGVLFMRIRSRGFGRSLAACRGLGSALWRCEVVQAAVIRKDYDAACSSLQSTCRNCTCGVRLSVTFKPHVLRTWTKSPAPAGTSTLFSLFSQERRCLLCAS